jgi:anaerobic selenocysteine-containing dehydrogenase
MITEGYCALCRSRCGTVNIVEDGRFISVEANPGHPTGASICPKGRAAPEIVYSPERLLYPLRRTSPKGSDDPAWKRVPWSEALDQIAERLLKLKAGYGPESVGFSLGTPSGTPLVDSIEWIDRFIRLFGSPNVYAGVEVCNWHKDVAHTFTFGCPMPPADYPNADLIILWGHNPPNVWLAEANAVAVGRRGGAQLVVVDPRGTALAKSADHWLRVKPGTDIVVALGLIRLLILSETYDANFVRAWTNAPFLVREDTCRLLRSHDVGLGGNPDAYVVWDQVHARAQVYDPAIDHSGGASAFALEVAVPFRVGPAGEMVNCRPVFGLLRAAVERFTPEYVEEVSWVEKSRLLAVGDALAKSKRIAYHAWTGIAQHLNATQTERAIALLYALTGSFDTLGGNVNLRQQPVNPLTSLDLLPIAQQRKAIGLDKRPLGPPRMGRIIARDMFQAILDGTPYPIRALIGFGGNPLLAQADTSIMERALKSLPFYVHCDLFHTPTSAYADFLLPVSSPWEHEALKIGFEISPHAQELIMLRKPVASAVGESKADYEIVVELANRLGMGREFFGGNIDEGWNHVLAPLGITVGELRARPAGIRRPLAQSYKKYAEPTEDGVLGFATETHRVEIYSEQLLVHGYAPIPDFAEGRDLVATNLEFPYVLTSAKNRNFCQSQHRNIPSLRRRSPAPTVAINPGLAASKGIEEGGWVSVQTRVGKARFIASFDDTIHPGVVFAEHGWWAACPELGYSGFGIRGGDGSNVNSLISADHADPISGAVPLRSFACNIEPYRTAESQAVG